MSGLSSDAQRLIAETRELDEPSPADRDRIRARLDASWSGPAAAPRPRGKLWLATTSIVLMAGVGGWLARSPEKAPLPSVAQPQLIAAPSVPAAQLPAAPESVQAPAAAPQPRAAAVRKKEAKRSPVVQRTPPAPEPVKNLMAQPATSAPTPAASAPPEALATRAWPPARMRSRAVDERPEEFAPHAIGDEVSLLGAAERELRAGQPTRALGFVRQHAFRFPTGALAQERDAVHALALCALNRKSAARQVFEDLQRRAPAAAVLTRIKHDCGF